MEAITLSNDWTARGTKNNTCRLQRSDRIGVLVLLDSFIDGMVTPLMFVSLAII